MIKIYIIIKKYIYQEYQEYSKKILLINIIKNI